MRIGKICDAIVYFAHVDFAMSAGVRDVKVAGLAKDVRVAF